MTKSVVFIGFGDIRRSMGARVYLTSLLKLIHNHGFSTRAVFLQQVVEDGAGIDSDQNTIAVESPPLRGFSRKLPGVMWRIYEHLWGLWRAFRIVNHARTRGDVCIITGAPLLILTPYLRRRFSTVLYVLHGIAEESLLSGSTAGTWRYRLFKVLERTFLRGFNSIVVVSEQLAAYCRREYGVQKFTLVPCCVEPGLFQWNAGSRQRSRALLGLEGRFVFVYSGGAASWQCFPEAVAFFRLAAASIPHAFFLVLTPDPEALTPALTALAPTDYMVRTVSHGEMIQYLCAGDAALLLRKRSIVNMVSAPVKFAEYLASGLPVLSSPYVGDYSALVLRHKIGVLLEPEDALTWQDAVNQLITLSRDPSTRIRCLQASTYLTWDAAAGSLMGALGQGVGTEEQDTTSRSVQGYVRQ